MQEREERVQLRLLLNTSTHFPSPLSHTYTLFLPSPFPTPLFHTHTPPSSPSMFIHTQIGWRRIRGSRHDLQQPKLVMVGNIIYPCIIFLLLTFACVSQIVTCFLRDQVCHSYRLVPPLSPLTLSLPPPSLSHSLSLSPFHPLTPSPSSLLVWWRTMVW